ncbi:hypothetical protein [Caldovatus sediminis]|uniref:hypothetical protein n=1 Tax=Caldovatus sediminis TaxID=2041189 RepID=UPI0016689940|nr:hypothetical protein [Caldovatus sediminis]
MTTRGAATQLVPDFAALAQRVMPAVVSISVTGEIAGSVPPALRVGRAAAAAARSYG